MPKYVDTTTEVLTIRVPRALGARLRRDARRQRRTPSAVARELLTAALQDTASSDPAAEARRQSLLVRHRESERETLRLITKVADLRGWE